MFTSTLKYFKKNLKSAISFFIIMYGKINTKEEKLLELESLYNLISNQKFVKDEVQYYST